MEHTDEKKGPPPPYDTQQGQYPPPQGYATQPGYNTVPQQPGYSAQPGYPPQQPGYPPQQPGYPPQQPGYPQQPGVAPQHAQYGQQGVTVIHQQPSAVIVTSAPKPNDYLGFSIFTCLCCFWPTGIAAILFSCQSRDAGNSGDVATAEAKGSTARTLGILSLVLGIICIVIIAVLRLVVYSNTGTGYYG